MNSKTPSSSNYNYWYTRDLSNRECSVGQQEQRDLTSGKTTFTLGFNKFEKWAPLFFMIALLFFTSNISFAQYCLDGDYCPNMDFDGPADNNACFPGIIDEYINAAKGSGNNLASQSCEIRQTWADALLYPSMDASLFYAFRQGSAGVSTFRTYINTDCNSATGQLMASQNFGMAPFNINVSGAEAMIRITTSAVPLIEVYLWDGANMVLDAGLTAGAAVLLGDSDGCTGSDQLFVEAEIPILNTLFDVCSDDGCGSVTLTRFISNTGLVPTAQYCTTRNLNLQVEVNSPPTAVITGLSSCVYSDTEVCFNGSDSFDPNGDMLLYEWDTDYDGMTFDADVTGVEYCMVFPVGTYTIGLRVTDTYGCSDITSTVMDFVVEDSNNVTFCTNCFTCDVSPEPNPPLSASCEDLKVALVLDESASVGGFSDEVKAGVEAFVNSLSCTGVELSIVEFSSGARYVLDQYQLVDDAVTAAVEDYFDNVNNPLLVNNADYTPNGNTNYHAALLAVDSLISSPDLVFFFTDGAPTMVYLTNPPPPIGTSGVFCGDFGVPTAAEIGNATIVANKLKCEGSHIFVLGVGGITAAQIPTIEQISGPVQHSDMTPISMADYALDDFEALAECLTMFVTELCPFDTETTSQAICPGSSNGSIILTAPSEFVPFDYAYFSEFGVVPLGSGTSNQEELIIGGLSAGTYRVEISVTIPGGGCMRTEVFFIDVVAGAPLVDAMITNVTIPNCNDVNSGSVTLEITQGVLPYEITLKKEGVIQPGFPVVDYELSTFTQTGLSIGNYTFEITDFNMCNIEVVPFVITAPPDCCEPACPMDITISCEESTDPSNTGEPNAPGGCVMIDYSDSNSGDLCNGTITRSWVFTDDFGTEFFCDQIITIVDNTAPVISTCPVQRDLTGCDELDIIDPPYSASNAASSIVQFQNATNMGVATDACNSLTVSYMDVVSGTCPVVVTRTWVVSDICGNSSTCNQTINIQDITPPVITCPANLTLDCPADTMPSNTGIATAVESCSTATISYSNAVTQGTCMGEYTVTRTWTAMDECGNTSTCNQIIEVQDITDPIITCPIDVTLNCPADTMPSNTGIATAIDECNMATISYSNSVTAGSCTGEYTLTRTWIATDDCGNMSSCDQVIFVQDITAPIITCPPNLTLTIPADTMPSNTGVATATDVCSSATVNYSDAVVDGICDGFYTVTRTWVATDACGNTASCNQIINVQDTESPVITCPIDVTLDCPADTMPSNTGMATATDESNTAVISYSDMVVNGSCGGNYIVTRTWVATDDCGNSSSCDQIITVEDMTAPIITCPIDVTLDCPADTMPSNTGMATATDGCSGISISYSDNVTQGMCAGAYNVTRTWLATDDCGNTAMCNQSIIVQDITSPIITCPIDVTLDCPADTMPSNTGIATSTDECNSAAITYVDVVSNEACEGEYLVTRTWIATDGCGNSATCNQIIQVQDITNPIITCPADVTLDCPADTSAVLNGQATATDACSTATITHSDAVLQGMCSGSYTVTRTWVATDNCGNSSSCDQIITVQDITAPIITCPIDATLEIPADTSTMNLGVATAMDECSGATISYTNEIFPGACDGVFTLERTWIATDDCGNSSSCVQTISVQDTDAPTIMCPDDVTLDCPADTSFMNTGFPTANDNNPTIIITYEDEISIGKCIGDQVIMRTWFATDDCGNSVSCLQNITVQDTTPPVIICPPNVTLDCTGDDSPDNTGFATATDECSMVELLFEDEIVLGGCANDYVIIRTWIAIDDCNNDARCDQTITVSDGSNPTIQCPIDVTLDCPADTMPSNTGMATGSDLCGDPIISYDDNIIPGECDMSFTIIRTWFASDECGNQTSCDQTIVVQDTIAPFMICPADATLNCPADTTTANNGVATATDNCNTPIIDYDDTVVQGNCLGEYVVTRTWTASDGCGNISSCIQMITVQDTTAPVIMCPPNLTLDFPMDTSVVNTGFATATDECSSATLSYSDAIEPGDCSGVFTVTRTWQAMDDCGNLSSCNQLLFVQDMTAPEISCPADVTLDCPADTMPTNTGFAVGMDPDMEFIISYMDDVVDGNCSGNYMVTRTWFVSDSCGNSSTCNQIITVQDITAPIIICPADLTLECPADTSFLNTGEAIVTDECSSTTLSHSDFIQSGECGSNYTINRTWFAFDECGNSASCVQLIEVEDNMAPAITCPADLTLECPADTSAMNTGMPTSSDLCGGVFNFSYVDVITGSNCPGNYTIERTWTVVDSCFNESSCIQLISVEDTTPPLISCPMDVASMCSSEEFEVANTIDEFIAIGGSVSDNCCLDSLSFSYMDTEMNMGSDTMFMREYIIRDCCGNISSCIQLLTVEDITPPVAMCVDTVTIYATLENFPITIPVDSVENGSFDNCGISSISLQNLTFMCQEFGADSYYNITLFVFDNAGNQGNCTTVVRLVCPKLFDLALIKEEVTVDPLPTQDLEYTITVINQGSEPADSITIIDYLPEGYVLNDPNWTISTLGPNGDSPIRVLSVSNGELPNGGLESDETVTVSITISPIVENEPGYVINEAEIYYAIDLEGVPFDDYDSNYDDDNTNDAGGNPNGATDNTINGDGSGEPDDNNVQGDEDDHDPAAICVRPIVDILGFEYVCPNAIQEYRIIPFDDDQDYIWLVTGGMIVGMTDSTIIVEWGDEPGNYEVRVTAYTGDSGCFTVAIKPIVIEGDSAFACNNAVNVSLNAECEIIVSASFILEGEIYPDSSYTIVMKDQDGNIIPGNILTEDYLGQQIEVSVYHNCTGNSCWGYINIADKLAPQIICPQDTIISCEEYANYIITDPELVGGGCGSDEVFFYTEEIDGDCTSDYAYTVVVSYVAIDQSGNVSDTCYQNIFVERQSLENVQLPDNFDGLGDNPDPLSCSGTYELDNNGNPSPAVTGMPFIPNSCSNVVTVYSDEILPICITNCSVSSSYKILRKWSLVDWCTSEVLEHIQIIKIMDLEGPSITPINDYTVSASNYDCSALIIIPNTVVIDNCSPMNEIEISYTSSVGSVVGQLVTIDDANAVPNGEVFITMTATDCCGNTSTIEFTVTIVDNVPPVVVAEQFHTVSLSSDGFAVIYAASFDDGSHDGCSDITFSVKRMDNGGSCAPIDNFPPAGDDNAQFNEIVHFCCADIGTPVMVQFRVCDAANNCNMAMVEVEVQDKLAPAIVCPPNTTVACSDIAGIDWDNDELVDNMFGSPFAAATCNVEINRNININYDCPDGSGNLGSILRFFTASNDFGSAACVQTIDIVGLPTSSLTCERIGFDVSSPFFSGLSASKLAKFNAGPNSYWCNSEEDIDAFEIDCNDSFVAPDLDIDISGLCTEVGISVEIDTFYFAGGACRKYLLHYEAIDQCVFDENYVDPTTGEIDPYNSDNGYFELYLEVDAFDEEAPSLNCEKLDFGTTSCTGADVEVNIEATDNCSTPEYFGYQWRIDVGNDNTIDFPAEGWFLTKNVTADQLGWTEFPIGEYGIYWIINDGCGNSANCYQVFTVYEDDNTPTAYCYDGLSTAVMPANGQVTMWASDFDAGSFDACDEELSFTMIPDVDVVPGTDGYDDSEASWTFDCSYLEDGVTAMLDIRVYVTNEQGGYDFCIASLRIDDNFDVCPNNFAIMFTAEGQIVTEYNSSIEGVDVRIDSDYPEFPMLEVTNEEGLYSFSDDLGTGKLYQHGNYVLEANHDVDYMNGVSTLDLILLQKHILQVDVLDSPYQLIAADINKDCSITGSDLVQLRKLILGLYQNDDLPNNTSWRFVDSEFEFPDVNSPCEFDESVSLFDLMEDVSKNMIGIKIGDLNGSAETNLDATNIDTRSNQVVHLVIDDMKVESGDIIEIPVKAKNFNQVYGFQYTLEFDNADFVDIIPVSLALNAQNIGRFTDQADLITTSFDIIDGVTFEDGETLFIIQLKVNQSSTLHDLISLTSSHTFAEAYIGNTLEENPIELLFADELGEESIEFHVYQNEPNPFSDVTKVGFDMPYTADAKITVFDVSGRVIYSEYKVYQKGYNELFLSKENLNDAGVMYVQIQVNDLSETVKMIRID